jgi:hypothetical protein
MVDARGVDGRNGGPLAHPRPAARRAMRSRSPSRTQRGSRPGVRSCSWAVSPAHRAARRARERRRTLGRQDDHVRVSRRRRATKGREPITDQARVRALRLRAHAHDGAGTPGRWTAGRHISGRRGPPRQRGGTNPGGRRDATGSEPCALRSDAPTHFRA